MVSAVAKVAVVGSGPVAMRLAQELLRRDPSAALDMFGNEPSQPYNRVQLSALLAGEIRRQDIDIPLPDPLRHPHFHFRVATISHIDLATQTLRDSHARSHGFATLVLATGARAHIPSIPGVAQAGVYTFRSLGDAEALMARLARARNIVVAGGGLLGLEAARGLMKYGTRVTLVQQGEHLMNRQLDEVAARLLQARVEALGIRVITQSGVRRILGEGKVSGVVTHAGEHIACDTVLICAGIKPNMELARAAGISVRQGILVDDQLRTSHPNVYAVGECCEHHGATYGLVSPGYEQAAVAADVIAGGSASYHGSLFVSRLKVVGEQVLSMGSVNADPLSALQKEYRYQDAATPCYRKLVLRRGRIHGAVGFGTWPELPRVQEAFQQGRYLWPWQRLSFVLRGKLWMLPASNRVTQWPGDAIVCQCNSIARAGLQRAMSEGACTVAALGQATGAGTVCGSCKPLLAELVGDLASVEPAPAARPVLIASLGALVIALLVMALPEARTATSFQDKTWFEAIWNDAFWKQVTGFTMLGLAVVSLLLSVRKRLRVQWLGKFAWWRVVHAGLGMACATLLIFHTGFHGGANLNKLLLMNFLAVLVLGAATGGVVALAHHLRPGVASALRQIWSWAHILVVWPLPALLAAHILTVYYF